MPSSRVIYRSTPPIPEGPYCATSYSMLTLRLLITGISARALGGATAVEGGSIGRGVPPWEPGGDCGLEGVVGRLVVGDGIGLLGPLVGGGVAVGGAAAATTELELAPS